MAGRIDASAAAHCPLMRKFCVITPDAMTYAGGNTRTAATAATPSLMRAPPRRRADDRASPSSPCPGSCDLWRMGPESDSAKHVTMPLAYTKSLRPLTVPPTGDMNAVARARFESFRHAELTTVLDEHSNFLERALARQKLGAPRAVSLPRAGVLRFDSLFAAAEPWRRRARSSASPGYLSCRVLSRQILAGFSHSHFAAVKRPSRVSWHRCS